MCRLARHIIILGIKLVPTQSVRIAKQLDKQDTTELLFQQRGVVKCIVNTALPVHLFLNIPVYLLTLEMLRFHVICHKLLCGRNLIYLYMYTLKNCCSQLVSYL